MECVIGGACRGNIAVRPSAWVQLDTELYTYLCWLVVSERSRFVN